MLPATNSKVATENRRKRHPKGNIIFQPWISRGELLVSGRGNGNVVSKQIPIFTITPSVWNLGVFGGIVAALNGGGPI